MLEPATSGTLQRLLVVASIVEIAVGLLHFAMPAAYRQSPALGRLSSAEDDFFALMTFAVGILLVAFGVLTLAFARLSTERSLLVAFLGIKTLLWIGRVALELVLPIQIELFGIAPFTAIVLPGVVAQLGIVVGATALALRSA